MNAVTVRGAVRFLHAWVAQSYLMQRIGNLARTYVQRAAWIAAMAIVVTPRTVEAPRRPGSKRTQAWPVPSSPTLSIDVDPDPAATDSLVPEARVAITSSGARIIDKRRVSIDPTRPATPSSATGVTEPGQPGKVRQPRCRRWRGIMRTVDVAWLRLLGRLIFTAQRTPLPSGLSSVDLGRLAWTRPVCRALLCDKHDSRWRELVDLAVGGAEVGDGDWRLPVVWWLKRHIPPADLVVYTHAALCAPDPAGSSDRRLALHLRLAGHVATFLSEQQARDILSIALARTREPMDPYTPGGSRLVARAVVRALLEQRPELDDHIHATLQIQRGEHPTPADAPLPVEVRLLTMALRGRATGTGAALTRTAVAAGLGSEQLQAAARLADSTLISEPRLRTTDPSRAPWTVSAAIGRHGLPWVAPPAITIAAAAVVHRAEWNTAPLAIGLAEAIALLALLVTVNVFTVTLSATRLPGIVARSAGRPWLLLFSYSAALTLLALVLAKPHIAGSVSWLQTASGWAALAAFILHVFSLLAAMFLLLRRTDAARATAGYLAATAPTARATGRRLGRIQARTVILRDALASVPAVTMTPDTIAGEWSQEITGRRRGFFTPSLTALRRLLDRPAFAGGMRLRIIAGLGTIVDRDGTIATLVPARDQTVTPRLARTTTAVLRTRPSARVEDIASGAVALTQTALDLARVGDIGTAHTVAQHVVSLLTQHIAAARHARIRTLRWHELRVQTAHIQGDSLRAEAEPARVHARTRDTEPVPVIPALRDVLRVAIQARLNTREDHLDIQDTLIWPLLSATLQPEAAVAILIYKIPTNPDETTAGATTTTELLRIAGIRALELRSALLFDQALDHLRDTAAHTSGRANAIGISSVLAATATSFNPQWACHAADKVVKTIATHTPNQPTAAMLRVHSLWRIGAAGLACGALSVAVHAARMLHDAGEQHLLIALAADEDTLVTEAARSCIRGGYLGDHAQDALANYATFLTDLDSIL